MGLFKFYETDATVTEFNNVASRLTTIESKLQYVEVKIYSSWSGSQDEGKNTDVYSYFTLPSGVTASNLKKVDFYFNETPYAKHFLNGNRSDSTNPVAGNTKSLTPGASFSINQDRCSWIIGIAGSGDCRPYVKTRSSYNGYIVYWNISLTFYI